MTHSHDGRPGPAPVIEFKPIPLAMSQTGQYTCIGGHPETTRLVIVDGCWYGSVCCDNEAHACHAVHIARIAAAAHTDLGMPLAMLERFAVNDPRG